MGRTWQRHALIHQTRASGGDAEGVLSLNPVASAESLGRKTLHSHLPARPAIQGHPRQIHASCSTNHNRGPVVKVWPPMDTLFDRTSRWTTYVDASRPKIPRQNTSPSVARNGRVKRSWRVTRDRRRLQQVKPHVELRGGRRRTPGSCDETGDGPCTASHFDARSSRVDAKDRVFASGQPGRVDQPWFLTSELTTCLVRCSEWISPRRARFRSDTGLIGTLSSSGLSCRTTSR